MCSPPAKRSSAAISARRQHGLVTSTRLSSSLTAAVIAIVSSPHLPDLGAVLLSSCA